MSTDHNDAENVADALLVLSEMARERGLATVAELGDLPPLDPFTKAKYLAMAKRRLEAEPPEGEMTERNHEDTT